MTHTMWSSRNLIPVALMALLALGAGAAQARRRVSPELVARASREGAVRIIVQLDLPTRLRIPVRRMSSFSGWVDRSQQDVINCPFA